jgi:hypothetical protein
MSSSSRDVESRGTSIFNQRVNRRRDQAHDICVQDIETGCTTPIWVVLVSHLQSYPVPLHAEQVAETRSCYSVKGFHSRWPYHFLRISHSKQSGSASGNIMAPVRFIPSFSAFYKYNSVCDSVRYPARTFWLISRGVGDRLYPAGSLEKTLISSAIRNLPFKANHRNFQLPERLDLSQLCSGGHRQYPSVRKQGSSALLGQSCYSTVSPLWSSNSAL